MPWKSEIVGMIETGQMFQRGWIHDGSLKAYIRVTQRLLPTGKAKTIDIASAEVHSSDRGKGHFKRFVEGVEELAKEHGRAVFAEGVMNLWLVEFFKKRGYKEINNTVPPCLYKEQSKTCTSTIPETAKTS